MRTKSFAFSKTNLREGRGVGEKTDAGLGTMGGVRILVGKLSTCAVVVEATLCGSLNEKSSNKVVEIFCWSKSLAVTVERKVKNAMSAA